MTKLLFAQLGYTSNARIPQGIQRCISHTRGDGEDGSEWLIPLTVEWLRSKVLWSEYRYANLANFANSPGLYNGAMLFDREDRAVIGRLTNRDADRRPVATGWNGDAIDEALVRLHQHVNVCKRAFERARRIIYQPDGDLNPAGLNIDNADAITYSRAVGMMFLSTRACQGAFAIATCCYTSPELLEGYDGQYNIVRKLKVRREALDTLPAGERPKNLAAVSSSLFGHGREFPFTREQQRSMYRLCAENSDGLLLFSSGENPEHDRIAMDCMLEAVA